MYRPEAFASTNGTFDVIPSPSPSTPLVFPSEARHSYDYRPRSQSADTRRPFSEEHHDDGAPMHHYYHNTPTPPPRHSNHSAQTMHFPSNYREHRVEQHATPQQQFNSPAHNFTQHLRERSPSSSSALLNLLQRYPSARQSVYSVDQRVIHADHQPVDTQVYRPSDVSSNFPLVELTVPRSPPLSFGRRTLSLPHNNHDTSFHSPESLSSLSFHSEYRGSPVFSHSDKAQTLLSALRNSEDPLFPSKFNNRSAHKFYTDETNNNHLPQPRNNLGSDKSPDITQLDSFLASVFEDDDDMSRSTSEWRNSFAQMQQKFRERPPETNDSAVFHGFTSSGAPTLPRRGPLLSKSSSHHEVPESLLASAVQRRASEAPELRRSGAIDSFWSQTVSNRPSSPTIQRIPSQLTAAERLQLLHEPTDGPAPPQRAPEQSTSLAVRREQYMNEVANRSTSPSFAHHYQNSPASPVNAPNFSALDNAVKELNHEVRATGYSHSARRLGGCARFPTDEHAFSPPRQSQTMHNRILNSPSPTDSVSESSSVYQVPTGLPHPKPKHNIKEQLYQMGNVFPRGGLRVSPNFPVPTTGSVASRITEFEKRPGTPTLQIINVTQKNERVPSSGGAMSPKSSVFRAKPVIHVDIGSHQMRSPHQETAYFEFPHRNQTWNVEPVSTDLHDTSKKLHIDALNDDLSDTFINKFQRLGLEGSAAKSPNNRSIVNETTRDNFDSVRKVLNFDDPSFQSPNSSNTSDSSTDQSKSVSHLKANKSLRHIGEENGVTNKSHQLLPSPPRVVPKENIPRFYFPQGKPVRQEENDNALRRVCEVFRSFPNQSIPLEDIGRVCEAANIPLYWKKPLFLTLTKGATRSATQMDFTAYWRAMTSVAHDEAARFVYTLTGGSGSKLEWSHFVPLMMDIIYTHPGLEFYRESVEFHDKYCDVVITRIFWNAKKAWSNYLTAADLRNCDLLENIRALAEEDDINRNIRYFSYEHFYVIYCNFWELDQDHDMLVTKDDMMRYRKNAIPPFVIDRIFSGCVRRYSTVRQLPDRLSIIEFTQFLIADEDKNHPMSIEYWFRIVDLDGDGIITLFDMETFYGLISDALCAEGFETLKFSDVVCHLIDAIEPADKRFFRLSDLKNNRLAPKFFNSLVNWRKFYHQETNEVSDAVFENDDGQELTEWDRFCIEEYELLMESACNDGDVVENFEVHLEDDDDVVTSASFHDLL